MIRLVLLTLSYISIIATSMVIAEPYNYLNTTVTRWADPDRRPMTYREYLESYPLMDFNYRLVNFSAGMTDDPLPFVVIVNDSLYYQVEESILQYCADLTADGYGYSVYTASGGTPADIKEILISEWNNDAVGALLVGDLPVPWFELYEDFDNDGEPDNPFMVSFPCDLYYMDLDGIWDDEDSDGIFDVHEGNWEPDIWAGTLKASTIYGFEESLTNHYFEKNHAYRIGELVLPDRALAYIDDDWAGGAPDWADAVEQAWANTELVNEINITTADNLVERWDDDYTHILLASHSSPLLHSLKENNGTSWDEVYWNQIANGDPHFLFYNLFACSNARYIEDNNMGSNYIFTNTYGINAIGSTKTGSMLYFDEYYEPLGAGVTVGEALRVWFTAHGNQPGSEMWARSWFYGMTNLGDPSLRTSTGIHLTSYEIIDDGTGSTFGDGDGIADNGEWIEFILNLTNSGPVDYENVYIDLSSDDPYVHVLSGTGYAASIAAGDSVLISGLRISIDEHCPDLHDVSLAMEIGDTQGHIWYDGLDFTVRAPQIELVSYEWREISGDMDGILDEGETIGLTFTLNNFGGQECYKFDPLIMSEQSCFSDDFTEGIYYFPLDSQIVIGEFETDFLYFPDGNAGIGMFGFVEQTDEWVYEPFFLPGGQTMNIYYPVGSPPSSWKQYAVSESYNCEWTFDSLNYVSPNVSYHYGLEEEYPPISDGVAELPLINVTGDAELTFEHFYEIEEGYDGGQVEIRTGENWTLIEPEGGYPGSSVSNGSYPGGACYNGEVTEWTEAVFDLSAYAGECVKLRFRFGSDGGVEGEGWNIDDIRIDNSNVGVGDQIEGTIPAEFRVYESFPNPFNTSANISFSLPNSGIVKVSVFDIQGRETAVLQNGVMEPGMQNIVFNGDNLSSGVYFYRVEFAGEQAIKKSILLK